MSDLSPRQHLERVYQTLIYSDLLDRSLDRPPAPETVEACKAIREAQAQIIESLRQMPMEQPETPDGYWPGFCLNCLWRGPSSVAHGGNQIADTGDYSDVVCPVCETPLEAGDE